MQIIFIRLQQMHEVLTIVTDFHGVCLSVAWLKSAAVRRVYAMCHVHGGHLVQPSPNAFGLMLSMFMVSVCQSVCHAAHLGCAVQNGWTDQDAVLGEHSWGILIPPQRGVGVPTFKFWDPHISGMGLGARDLKFCTHIERSGPK